LGLAPEGPPTPPPHISRVLTPAFASALKQSPVLLRQLCAQLFRKYDVNKDGVLEREEVEALAVELSQTLRVPVSPPSPMSAGGLGSSEPVTMEVFCGWLPMVRLLRLVCQRHLHLSIQPPGLRHDCTCADVLRCQ